jgi:hypothetical protein
MEPHRETDAKVTDPVCGMFTPVSRAKSPMVALPISPALHKTIHPVPRYRVKTEGAVGRSSP